MTDALPLYDRALAVTQAEPALTDLRLLLQINKAVTLGDLDQYDGAFAAARQAQQLADRAGIMVRRAQAHCCLGQLLFHTGRWDDALTEVGVVQEVTKDPGVACCDHGVAAVICFHRGDTSYGPPSPGRRRPARQADREPGGRHAGPGPQRGLRAGRRADRGTRRADRVHGPRRRSSTRSRICWPTASGWPPRSATRPPRRPSRTGPWPSPDDSEIPHRQANALCCRGLVDHDAGRLLRAAERYHDARRPLPGAKALEAAAGALVDRGDRDPARAAFTRAVDLYSSLGATRDVARLQARFRAHGIRRAPRVKHRRARRGWESLTPAEAKIAALVAEGMTNPQIAARLFLSHRTVATHVSHILGKLDVRSRIDIAREVTDRRAVAS